MMFEYESVWPLIPSGGFLLSDDIKWNSAYPDFKTKVNFTYDGHYRGLGIIRK